MTDAEHALELRDKASVLARHAVRKEIQRQGVKISGFTAKQIADAALCLVYSLAIEALIEHNYKSWNGE